jgi:diguanylate cyclase (GGDEF)-like protein
MKDKFTFDVFISYNHVDQNKVNIIAESLREKGLKVWYDKWIIKPGHDIYQQIQIGLELSRNFVLCMSNEVFKSEWASFESSTAIFRDPMNKERRFIPILLENCNLPDTIKRISYIDAKELNINTTNEIFESCVNKSLHELYTENIENNILLEIIELGNSAPRIVKAIKDIGLKCQLKGIESYLVYMDIDNMTIINKLYTEQIGDLIIKEISKVFNKQLKPNFAKHWREDEFIGFILNNTQDKIQKLSDKLCSEINKIKFKNIADLEVSVSIGVAKLKRKENPKQCLFRAILATIEAKKNGGNRINFASNNLPDSIPIEELTYFLS